MKLDKAEFYVRWYTVQGAFHIMYNFALQEFLMYVNSTMSLW